MSVYPLFPIRKHFFLPDRYGLLDRIDYIPAGFEGVGTVSRSYTNQHSSLTNLQDAFTMDDDVAQNRPALTGFIGNFLHFANGHTIVSLVFKPVNRTFLRIIADSTEEYVNSSCLS